MSDGRHADLVGWGRMLMVFGGVIIAVGIIIAWTVDTANSVFGGLALSIGGAALFIGGSVFAALAVTVRPVPDA